MTGWSAYQRFNTSAGSREPGSTISSAVEIFRCRCASALVPLDGDLAKSNCGSNRVPVRRGSSGDTGLRHQMNEAKHGGRTYDGQVCPLLRFVHRLTASKWGSAVIPDRTTCCSRFPLSNHTSVKPVFAGLEPVWTGLQYLEDGRKQIMSTRRMFECADFTTCRQVPLPWVRTTCYENSRLRLMRPSKHGDCIPTVKRALMTEGVAVKTFHPGRDRPGTRAPIAPPNGRFTFNPKPHSEEPTTTSKSTREQHTTLLGEPEVVASGRRDATAPPPCDERREIARDQLYPVSIASQI